MKKLFTLMIGTFLTFAMSSMAFAGGMMVDNSSQFTKNVTGNNGNARFEFNRLKVRADQSLLTGKKRLSYSASNNDVITDIEGKTKYFNKKSSGFVLIEDVVIDYSGDFGTKIVYGENNEVFIYNPLSTTNFNSYVKGFIEGDKITVPLPQAIYAFNSGNGYEPIYDLNAMKVVTMQEYGETFQTFVIDDEKDSVCFYIREDGSIDLEYLGNEGLLGVTDISTGDWIGYGDNVQIYTPYGKDTVSLPNGIELEDYAMVYNEIGILVKVGFTDDAVYFVGLLPYMPDAVLKADLKDGIASIPQNQLFGIYENFFITTRCGEFERRGSNRIVFAEGSYDLKIDTDAKEIRSVDPEKILIFNADEKDLVYLAYFTNLTLKYQDTMAGTPSNPSNLKYTEDWRGFFNFQFDISNVSTTQNVLDLENMYYSIFIDDEIMEFSSEGGCYSGIGEDEIWDEIPCLFDNGLDISGNGRICNVGIYPDGVTTIGVQLSYYCGKERTTSDIITLNLETGKINSSGIENLMNEGKVVSTTYFDINGRRVASPEKGMFIRQDVYDNGSMKTSKIILN